MIFIIFYTILYMAEAFILWQYCTAVLIDQKRKQRGLLSCIAGYTILFAIAQLGLFSQFWGNLLSIFIVHFIVMLVAYKNKWYTILLHAGLTTMILSTTELLVLAILSLFTENIYVELSYLALGKFISRLLYFLVLFTISHIIKKPLVRNNKPNKSCALLIIVPISSIGITITLFSMCLGSKLTFIQDLLISISATLVLIINILVFYYYDYSQKMHGTIEYYKMLAEHNDMQRILIHDIKNHLATILNMNDNSSSNKISEYITQIINEPAMQTSLKLCDNELLNVLLNRYKKLCEDKHISFSTDIRSNSINFLKSEEITSLFANLLDNAMEAAIQSEHPLIEIKASSKEGTVFSLITLTNSCDKEPLTDRHGNLVTSKSDKKSHGIGTKSIKRIVNSHDGNINYKFDQEFSVFSTSIMLKNS